jgi:hypothetical protein
MALLNEPLPVPETPVESQFQPVEGADEMLDMPLGTLIFRAGLIAPQQLEDALAEGLRSGKRLGEVLLSRGWLSEEDLARLLAGQKGLPYADLEKVAIDRELARAMSFDDARSAMALPVVTEFGLPVVAMADPDEAAMDRLRALLGPEVRFVVAAPSVLTRLIDEVLGGAPAPGLLVAPTVAEPIAPFTDPSIEQGAPVVEPSVEQFAPEELTAEPAPPETAAELEPVVPEPVAAQEIRPIIAEGDVDYPTFSEFQPIPETEIIKGQDEQLPAEVQMGDYGYYDDPSLLEGNAWQAGETGPPAAEPPAEPVAEVSDLSADQYDIEQPAEEPEALVEETEEAWQEPVEESAPEVVPEPIAADVEEPALEQPSELPEKAEEAWEEPVEESVPEVVPEPVAADIKEPALEQPSELPEEAADEPAGEDDLTATTPAWMRGEVNVITADVADFIDSGASSALGTTASPVVESGDVAASEPEPLVSEDEEPVEVEPVLDETTEAEADEQPAEPELAHIEPAAAEFGAESPTWANQSMAAAEEEAAVESAGDAAPEPDAAPEVESAPESGRGRFELVMRLVDGDRVPMGSFGTAEEAQEKAAEVFKQFAETKEGSWPFIGGRFLRPDTIVSIDVEQNTSGWGGSNARGRMFGDDESA